MPDRLPHVIDLVRPAVVARRPAVPNVENRADLDAVLAPNALAAVTEFLQGQEIAVEPVTAALFPEVHQGLVAPHLDPRPGIRELHRVAEWSAARHAGRAHDEWLPELLTAGAPIAVLEWLAGPGNEFALDPVHVWVARRRRTQWTADRLAGARTHAGRNEVKRLRSLEDDLLPLALPVVREVLGELRRAVQTVPI